MVGQEVEWLIAVVRGGDGGVPRPFFIGEEGGEMRRSSSSEKQWPSWPLLCTLASLGSWSSSVVPGSGERRRGVTWVASNGEAMREGKQSSGHGDGS